jgi:signal recognition particle receptor subunit beta
MAFFFPETRTITLCIVYDGLGTAGKTTNVQQLHDLFTYHRRSDVYTPEVHRERTSYFDWLDLAVGTLDDCYALRVQVLTVPGQFAFAARRWQLLKRPDAVVAVCDSTRGGLERSRLGLAFLHRLRSRSVCPDVPIVIQANKRDLPDAVTLDEFRAAIGVAADEPVIEAVATVGDGVRYTFLTALDRARERLREVLARDGIGALSRDALTPNELLLAMQRDDGDLETEALDLVGDLHGK